MRLFIFLALLFFPFLSKAQTTYSLLNVNSDLTKNANSVLIDEEIEVDVSVAGKLSYKIHQVRIVLNKNGNNDVKASTQYDKNTKIKRIEAFVYDAFGNKLEHYKKKNFIDVSAADGYSIYNDNRILYLSYTPTSYPYIVEFYSEFERNTTVSIPSWYPLYGYAKSTKKSEYKIIFDPSNKPRIKKQNLEGYEISVSENPNEIICTAENLYAIKYEVLSPPLQNTLPNVAFALNNFTLVGVPGAAKNWKEFGTWMKNNLLVGVDDIPEATVVEIKNLIRNETTNEAKARIIYNYLQEKVRYISIQIGIGGWRPMLASEVDKLSYGDCKALTNYTKTLLDAVGIPSYYTVLYAGDEEISFDKNFSTLEGNHAILGIPDGDKITWLECTSQEKPFGFIGDFCDDRDVLIVTPEGGKIVHTKVYTYDENLQDSKIKIKINENGSAVANFKSSSKGIQYGDKFRLKEEDDEDIREYYKDRWDNINGVTIQNYTLENDKENIVFYEEVNINIPKFCSKIGNDYLCKINVFNNLNSVPPRIESRKNNLYLSTSFEDVDVVEIEIPSNFSIDNLPESKTVENEFGSYHIEFKKLSENKIEYQRHVIFKKGTFSKEKYNDYRSFRRKIAKLDKTKIVLNKNQP